MWTHWMSAQTILIIFGVSFFSIHSSDRPNGAIIFNKTIHSLPAVNVSWAILWPEEKWKMCGEITWSRNIPVIIINDNNHKSQIVLFVTFFVLLLVAYVAYSMGFLVCETHIDHQYIVCPIQEIARFVVLQSIIFFSAFTNWCRSISREKYMHFTKRTSISHPFSFYSQRNANRFCMQKRHKIHWIFLRWISISHWKWFLFSLCISKQMIMISFFFFWYSKIMLFSCKNSLDKREAAVKFIEI